MAENARRIVFLDRDGTINVDVGYLNDTEKTKLIDGAAQAVGLLIRSGFTVVIVSNQSGIARGFATVEQVDAVNQKILTDLLEADVNAKVEMLLYCPHQPEDKCECRKPKIGMVSCLGMEYSKEESWIVGDKFSDIEFGKNLGLPFRQRLLVLTGHGKEESAKHEGKRGIEFLEYPDLSFAAQAIVENI